MFHIVAYQSLEAIAATLADLTGVTDPIFSQRNGHFIFTEDYKIYWAYHLGAFATNARIESPTINAVSPHTIWPLERAVSPGSFPRIHDVRRSPVIIPMTEEIQVKASNNSAATDQTTCFLCVAPANHILNRTVGTRRVFIRATSSIARVATAWSGPGAITFDTNPRGGWYAVNGAFCFTTTCQAFRLFFPRAQTLAGRILRPGFPCSNAIAGNLEYPVDSGYFNNSMGTMGVFHTFEPLQIEVYANAAGADTQTIILDCDYLGDANPAAQPPNVAA